METALVWQNLKKLVESYLHRRARAYLLVFLLFSLGACGGVLSLGYLPTDDLTALSGQLDTFVTSLRTAGGQVNQQVLLELSLLSHVRTVFLFWLLGATIVGLPLVLGLVLAEGFSSGFAAGIMVSHFGLNGVFLAGLTLLPKSLLAVPALLLAAVSSLSFSLLLLRTGLGWRPANLLQEFLAYSLLQFLAGMVFLLASLVESLVVPVFLRNVWPYLTLGGRF